MYKQVKEFDPAKMGKQAGWCLQNCRLGFGINRGTFNSAKDDMESQIKNGTFHNGLPPKDIAVPVYCDTASEYEHVIVSDHGTYYSDGYITNPNYFKVFGWGEKCDGERVVKLVEDKTKSNEEIADEVIKGYWGNGEERKRRLKDAGYDYNAIQKIVNEKFNQKQYYTIQYGDTLSYISERFGTPIDTICSWNNIANPNLIYAGVTIRVR